MEEAKKDPKLQETVLVRKTEDPEWKPYKKADLIIEEAERKQQEAETKIKELL